MRSDLIFVAALASMATFGAPATAQSEFATLWQTLSARCIAHLQGQPVDRNGSIRESGTKLEGDRVVHSQLDFEHDILLAYGRTSLDHPRPRGHCGLFMRAGVDEATLSEVEFIFAALAPDLSALGLADLGAGVMGKNIRFRTFGVLAEANCAVSASLRIEAKADGRFLPVLSTEVTGPGCTRLFMEAKG